ncbi:unnamed protein product, partial [Urochloa humidicola]
DERRDWVGGEREHGRRGDADDVRRNSVKLEPPQRSTPRTGIHIFFIRPLSLRAPWWWCLLLDDDRFPFVAASRRSPPRSGAAGAAAAAGQGDAIEQWTWGSGSYRCGSGGYGPRGRRRGGRHGARASGVGEWRRHASQCVIGLNAMRACLCWAPGPGPHFLFVGWEKSSGASIIGLQRPRLIDSSSASY